MIEQLLEVKRLQGSRLWVTVHANRPTGIDKKYFALHGNGVWCKVRE